MATGTIKTQWVKIGEIDNVQFTASGNYETDIPNSVKILNAWVENSTGYIISMWKIVSWSNWYFHIYDTTGATVTSQPTVSKIRYAYIDQV